MIRALLILILALPSLAIACEPCALYNARGFEGHVGGMWSFAISEQYTNLNQAGDLDRDSIEHGELVKGYSTTQLSLAYDFNEQFGLQVTLPVIARSFDKIDH